MLKHYLQISLLTDQKIATKIAHILNALKCNKSVAHVSGNK